MAAFLTDSGGFGGGLGFMGYSTVVPSLVMLLTNSEPLVGLRYFGPDCHKKIPMVGDYKKK